MAVKKEKEAKNVGSNIAMVRVEQLYPFPDKQVKEIIAKYGEDKKYIWVQEEPENMGAWNFIMGKTRKYPVTFDVISRSESGSPASGSPIAYKLRHQAIMDKLFGSKVKELV